MDHNKVLLSLIIVLGLVLEPVGAEDQLQQVYFGMNWFTEKPGGWDLNVPVDPWKRTSQIGFFPPLGREAFFEFDLTWTGGEEASLEVLGDWHYTNTGRFTSFYILPSEKKILAWDWKGKGNEFPLTMDREKPVRLKFLRSADVIKVYVDGKFLGDQNLAPLHHLYNGPKDEQWGSFSLKSDIRDHAQGFSIRNLKYSGIPSPIPWEMVRQNFTIQGCREIMSFTVLGEKTFSPWIHAQLSSSIPYLQSCGELYGVVPCWPNLGLVSCRGEYYDSGAAANGSGVVFQRASTDEKGILFPSVHELAHNWSLYYDEPWSVEGSADLAMEMTKELQKRSFIRSSDYLYGYADAERKEFLDAGDRFFLAGDMRETLFKQGMPDWKRIRQNAWKARVFMLQFYRLWGLEGWREFHRKLERSGQKATNQDFLDFTEKRCPYIGGQVGAGWLTPGESLFNPRLIFQDTDKDGLPDWDEKILGTNPGKFDTPGDGYSDWGKVQNFLDPLVKITPKEKVFITDGSPVEWTAIPSVVVEDSLPNDPGRFVSWSFYLDKDHQRLLVLVKLAKNWPDDAGESAFVTLDLDVLGDGDTDYRLNYFPLLDRLGFFYTKGAHGAQWNPAKWTTLDPMGIKGGHHAAVVELEIPFALIGNLKGLKVTLITGYGSKGYFSKSGAVEIK